MSKRRETPRAAMLELLSPQQRVLNFPHFPQQQRSGRSIYTMIDSSSSESEVEEVFEHYKLEGGIQASEGEGQGDLDMDLFVVGLNPKAQKVVREVLSKRKIVKEGNTPKVKGGAVSAVFQDPVGGSKKAKINFNIDRNSEDTAVATAVASNSRKKHISRKNTGSHGSESEKWTHYEII